ncbi:MAG: VanZ family protein [Hydrogenophilales bacterium 17-61-9]|nr:MAG: VanZ family protein [Hydrogenophilales bacterium 17-61-9]
MIHRLWRHVDLMRLWRMGGWLGIVATLIVSLMPPALGGGDTHHDKVAHLLGYALLMFWWAQPIVRRRWKLALAVVLFGVGIEGLQGLTPDRLPDPLDALANTAGVLLGWLAAHLSPNLPTRLATLPARYR